MIQLAVHSVPEGTTELGRVDQIAATVRETGELTHWDTLQLPPGNGAITCDRAVPNPTRNYEIGPTLGGLGPVSLGVLAVKD